MASKNELRYRPDMRIVDEQLPPSPALKAVKKRDKDYGMTEDEVKDRSEFIRCYMLQGHEALMMVPLQEPEYDFFIADCDVTDDEYCAFNTVDYQKTLRPFDKYGYAMKQIMEQVKNLAIDHSSINSCERRENVFRRYEALVDREFRQPLADYVRRFNWTVDAEKRHWFKKKIAQLNCRIIECKKIWGRYAPPENWDR